MTPQAPCPRVCKLICVTCLSGFVGCQAVRNAASILRRSPLLLDRNKSHPLTLSLGYRLILQFHWLCGTLFWTWYHLEISLFLSTLVSFSLSFTVTHTNFLSLEHGHHFHTQCTWTILFRPTLVLLFVMLWFCLSQLPFLLYLFFLCVVVCNPSIFWMYCVLSLSPYLHGLCYLSFVLFLSLTWVC